MERSIDDMVRIDRQEEGEVRAEKVANLGRRHARNPSETQRLRSMQRALEEAPDGQISLTDPDARAMATSARHSGLVGCNAQAAVDTETHLIVTHEVTNLAHDRDQLAAMATGAKAVLEGEEISANADKGTSAVARYSPATRPASSPPFPALRRPATV